MIDKKILHYKIIEKLGEGGMGVVYLAEDTKLKRQVAIKFLPRHIASNTDERKRFEIEAQAAAALNHSNITQIYAIEETDDDVFIAMEFVKGQELREEVGSKKLEVRNVIEIAVQIVEGLQAAHEKGIVHRDIKSSNIMITEKGKVKIMDFGLAKVGSGIQLTKEQSTLGTAPYMSPEQIRGEEVDQRSDIWSFGVVLHEMLTRKQPFKGDYEQAVIYAILNDQPEPISDLRSGVPLDLERIVNKILAKDPNERFQSTDDLLVDLKSVQKEIETDPTKTISSTQRIPISKLQKSNRFIYAGISIVVLLFLTWYFLIPSIEVKTTQKSIAVLPFKNLSEDKENEFFSDGVTEDIITQLSKIADLKVISRTSIMRFKNSSKSMKEIGRELDVSTILEGSVRRADNQVRIVAQLIDAENDKNLWAETYDKELTQIFAIQSDVAKQISVALKAKLLPAEKKLIDKKPTDNLDAYTYYLRGRQYYNLYQKEANETAIELFKKALQNDPNYALAYAGLGDAYGQRTNKFGYSSAWDDSAIVMSEKAISLDPNLAEGYKALGLAYQELGWYKKAMSANEKAVELNPNYDPAVGNLGWVNVFMGNLDDGMIWLKRSASLSPSNAFSYIGIAVCYMHMNETKNAEKYYLRALELQPNLPAANWGLANVYLTDGRIDKARDIGDKLPAGINELAKLRVKGSIEYFSGSLEGAKPFFEKIYELYPELRQLDVFCHLFTIYWKTGEHDKAEKFFNLIFNRVEQEIKKGNEDPRLRYDMAACYAARGNKQEAIKWLEEAVELGFRQYHFAQIDPAMESLYSDPHFIKIMSNLEKILKDIHVKVKNLEKQG
jgi:serine/threonine protein kinase